MKTKQIFMLLTMVMVLITSDVYATPVTVQVVEVDPSQVVDVNIAGFYNGGVYAGVSELMVNGVFTPSYCVDEWHYSTTSAVTYDLEPLPNALKGAAWIMENYTGSSVNAQVAIWELISSDAGYLSAGNFSVQPWFGYGSFTDAQNLVNQVMGLNLSDFNTAGFGLLHSGTYQDFMVEDPLPVPSVPEPATMLLLGSGLIGLSFGLRKKLKK